MLVEYGVADSAGQSVVPEAAIAHDSNSTFASIRTKGGRARSTEAVAHDAVSHVEWGKSCERMAADVCTDVQRTRFLLEDLHRRKERALRTPGAQSGGTRRHESREFGGRLGRNLGL